MPKTRERLTKAQWRYKKNFDARLRKRLVLNVYDYVYLRFERKEPNEHRHQHGSIVEGPYKVKRTDEKAVVLEKTDRSVEKVSSPRVVLVPKTKSKEEME